MLPAQTQTKPLLEFSASYLDNEDAAVTALFNSAAYCDAQLDINCRQVCVQQLRLEVVCLHLCQVPSLSNVPTQCMNVGKELAFQSRPGSCHVHRAQRVGL